MFCVFLIKFFELGANLHKLTDLDLYTFLEVDHSVLEVELEIGHNWSHSSK